MERYNKKITAEIRKIAGKLLAEEEVKIIVGYGKGKYTGKTTPVFITRKGEADRLVFNSDASMMLSKYLLQYPETRVGIVAKPCDTRAIAVYLKEGLLERENLVIIAINGCRGIEGNSACEECTVRNPVIDDYNAGELMSEEEIAELVTEKEDKLKKMGPDERKEYFQDEFSRCIRCYACRQACYVCYCEECFVESTQPFWVGRSVKTKDNFTFHLMRSMHLTGRCLNCGACEMVCPEGIDVRALTSRLYRKAEEIFAYKTGLDTEQDLLLSDYDHNDRQPGFIE